MPRTFIAIEATEEVRGNLKRVQTEMEQTRADLNLVNPENIHLTLRFLGDVDKNRIGIIKEAINEVSNTRPFEMEVKGLGVFPEPSFIRVIWAGVSNGSEEVVSLRRELDHELSEIDISSDDKEFTPHLTIARVKSGKAKDQLNSIVENKSDRKWGRVEVDGFELKKSELSSEGPTYTTLEKVELR